MMHYRQIATIELRQAGRCRLEAMAAHPKGLIRRAEIHEAKKRITEARWARLMWQLRQPANNAPTPPTPAAPALPVPPAHVIKAVA